jgi:hypothetical protein
MHSHARHILRSIPRENDLIKPILVAHTDLDWNGVRYLLRCESSEFRQYYDNSGGGRIATRSQIVSFPFDDFGGVRISSLNFQLLPYPWFAKNQGHLFGDVVFPPILPRVSTQRSSEENAKLISRFIAANLKPKFNSSSKHNNSLRASIFVDMQSINDVEIGSGGNWRDFTLVNWGLVYRVVWKLSLLESARYHRERYLFQTKIVFYFFIILLMC